MTDDRKMTNDERQRRELLACTLRSYLRIDQGEQGTTTNMKQCMILIVFVAALAGCGAAPVLPLAQAAAPIAPISIAPMAAATAAPAAPVITRVRYERSGGMSGRTQAYIIHADGSVEREGGTLRRGTITPALDPNIAANLFLQLADKMHTLKTGDYAPAKACCDRASYSLSIMVDSQNYTYTTIDAAPNQPQALADLLAAVQSYLSSFE